MKKMRSFGMLLAGIVIGVGITYAPDLYAASTKLLGSKVGNVLSVKIDDKTVGEGGVIGGTTYVPLRVIADSFGAEVVRVDKNEVVLSTGPDPTDVNMDKINAERERLITQIRDLNIKITNAKQILANKKGLEDNIKTSQETIDLMNRVGPNSPAYSESALLQAQKSIETIQKNISDAETNLPIWESELADLETQLAELQK